MLVVRGWGGERQGLRELELEREVGGPHGILWVWLSFQALGLTSLFCLCALPQNRTGVRGWMLASFLLLFPSAFPSTQTRQFYVSIQPPVGELMAPVFMSENEFKKEQGECSLW